MSDAVQSTPAQSTPAVHLPDLGRLEDMVFEAVVFDMDGTLIDSTAAVERSWITWAERYQVTAEDLADSHGIPAAAIVARLIPEELREEATRFITELEVADTAGVVPLPGAVEALAALPDQRRAIATSCTRPLMEVRVIASQIPRPRVIVTADDVERGKPAPDPFLLAAERLGVDPRRCLVVEDAVSGLTGAKQAGCSTLSVITTTARARLQGSGMADGIVNTLQDVQFVPRSEGVRVRLG